MTTSTLRSLARTGLLALLLSTLSAPALGHSRRPPGPITPIVPARAHGNIELVCRGAPCEEVVSRGQRWVVGELGERYAIALVNRSDLWLEAVVTVDGRSILDGQRRSSTSRGYLVPPRDRVVVDGWRVDRSSVAAFRFTTTGDAYASRMGDRSELGVIRVDFYPERTSSTWVPRPRPSPTPWDLPRDQEGRADPMREADEGAGDFAERPRSSAAKGAPAWDRDTRQGLGTQYGEQRHQPISERSFERASSTPSQTLVLRYDDRAGLRARGVLPRPSRPWRDDGPWVPPPPGWPFE